MHPNLDPQHRHPTLQFCSHSTAGEDQGLLPAKLGSQDFNPTNITSIRNASIIHHIIIATLLKQIGLKGGHKKGRTTLTVPLSRNGWRYVTVWICWLIVLNPKVLAIGSIVGTALHHQDNLLSVDVA